jgi:hypothetical protein
VTAYINNLRAIGAATGTTTTRRTQTKRQCDPTRECNVCVASTSSSSEPEPAPCHRTADAQRQARLDELTETSSPWTPSPATDNLHRISLCRSSPVRGIETGVSVVLLLSCLAAAQQHQRHVGL